MMLEKIVIAGKLTLDGDGPRVRTRWLQISFLVLVWGIVCYLELHVCIHLLIFSLNKIFSETSSPIWLILCYDSSASR